MEQGAADLFLLTKLESSLDMLLETGKEKQSLVIKGDSPGIERLIRKEEKILHGLKQIESQMEQKPLLLSEIDCGHKLGELQNSIAAKFALLGTMNEQNQKLISKSLEITRFELSLFIPQDNYSHAVRNQPIAFDKKV